jgi:DNA-binding NtrC family response regulator
VVEDNVAILNLAKKILTNFNYRVVTAQTPSAALRMAEMHADEMSLLITDVVMPEMNGRELAEKVKALCPGIKCLYMSGYTANIIAHRGVLNKDFQFIDKPFSVKGLTNKVRAVLDETEREA